MKTRLPILLLAFVSLFSCNKEPVKPKLGPWRVVLEVQDGKELPFMIDWKEDLHWVVSNADERIDITDIQVNGDSITIAHPVFEGVFKGVFTADKVTGSFIKPSLDRVVPFEMVHGDAPRFIVGQVSDQNVSGNWEMLFSAHSPEDRYIAKGIFEQQGDKVTGTIRTTTGDYRYLEGVMDGSTLKLSTFDGAHAFLFEAEVKDTILYGNFYSGNHWKEPFSAKRNETYELPDENTLTYLKEGYDRFDFSFPDTDGTIVSLSDEKFKDKVVVVQIMGTWCPNCLEETQYYTEYLTKNPSPNLEFISLAFEYAPKERAIRGINKLKTSVGVPYPILLAQYGSSSKQKANEKLPMLNHVLSYPTTIFIDREGAVRKIHTGFNGKATGEKYTQFTQEFEAFLTQLLNE
ncbi:TlpA disulfide reductase family protein [Aureisphaera galaxeae]|uniref:peroxiredoxin family protein n=1 Tax=Aureisphaera galaxeae TaxID=1538023 RepID=UPI00235096CC|nr:TlpA disulfide reductase family protein [Aureisphaera galaxeae]MDC8004910.1 TlpA disulfide reductase family protein [Aureisphaera galaxeae]